MVIDLYQHVPEIFVEQVTKIIEEACETNSFPQEWVETIQILIPVKARPQSVNDYRKISIRKGYRIYASYLLKLLDEEIDAVGHYQTVFMRYRSTDDHIFVVRRILIEKWKESLDKKLKITKAKSVKREYPLSPQLFTIVLDDVLRTQEELVREIRLDQDAEINLPVILSFADDIIIIVGLKLNETKNKLLIDPINECIANQTQEINGVLITLVNTIKYRDTYLTSEQSQRNTIKARCRQAIRNAQVALTKSNRTRLRQYERKILKDILQAAKNQYRRKRQGILEGKTITKIIKGAKGKGYISKERCRNYKIADEPRQLPEENTESSAPSKENEERKTNFLAKGCTNTGWFYTPVTPNPS
ncbi:hypothetical protein EVAR_64264_1 [Eumeta japonica]|uniref:Reverse transcriptase domain-containing protein n=1 Tax=Eumeta variegata TaxID=151549 RepID=A0A4C1YXE5_EUMVA|nr:hypothetical protein EVAR_64264_1 [Eumeta japonica]